MSKGSIFGVRPQSGRRPTGSTFRKNQNRQKGIGKIGHTSQGFSTKNVRHFGHRQKFSGGFSLSQSLHRSHGAVCGAAHSGGLGLSPTSPPCPGRPGQTGKRIVRELARTTVPHHHFPRQKKHFIRCLQHRLGRRKYFHRGKSSQLLERGGSHLAHQPKRIVCNLPVHSKFGKTWANHPPQSGQSGHILLPPKNGRQSAKIKYASATPVVVVPAKQGHYYSRMGSLPRHGSRQAQPVVLRPWRLSTRHSSFHKRRKHFSTSSAATNRHVCQPWKPPAEKFVSRWPHWEAWGVDALHMDLSSVGDCYANPPWNLINQWLLRLRENPQIRCLMVVPFWVGSSFWPLLVRLQNMQAPRVLIPPREGLFLDCHGQPMPPTRWPLLCLMLSGSFWKENKFHLAISRTI